MWKAEEDDGIFDDDVELMERRVHRNKEKLQYIARDAQFARMVKAIHVYAHREWDFADIGEEPQDNLDISKSSSVDVELRVLTVFDSTHDPCAGSPSAPPVIPVARYLTGADARGIGCASKNVRTHAHRTEGCVRRFLCTPLVEC